MNENSNTSFARATLRTHARMRWRRLVNAWPFLAWLAVVVVAVFFYTKSTQFGTLSGSVQTIRQEISPPETARVQQIFVKVGDTVTNGQVVAQMDTTMIDAQVAQAEATLSAAEGSWATYEAQMLSLVRGAEDEIASAQASIDQQKGQRDSDTAKLAELKSMQAKREELFKNKLISETEADALRPEIAGLEKSVPAYATVISLLEKTLERRKKDRENLQQSLRVGADENVMKGIALKTAAQTEILKTAVNTRKLEKGSYSLQSTTDGVVSDVAVFPGTFAKPGSPVVTIVSKSRLIIGYLPEIRCGSMKVGDEGYAFRLTRPAVKVRVTAVSPEIEPIPSALRPTTAAQQSGVTFRAQRVVFEVVGSADITSGESVQIRLKSDWWARTRSRLGF